MADYVIQYLKITWDVIQDFDTGLGQADLSENTAIEAGKGAAIDKVDEMVAKLQEFRMDIKRLSLKALKAKY